MLGGRQGAREELVRVEARRRRRAQLGDVLRRGWNLQRGGWRRGRPLMIRCWVLARQPPPERVTVERLGRRHRPVLALRQVGARVSVVLAGAAWAAVCELHLPRPLRFCEGGGGFRIPTGAGVRPPQVSRRRGGPWDSQQRAGPTPESLGHRHLRLCLPRRADQRPFGLPAPDTQADSPKLTSKCLSTSQEATAQKSCECAVSGVVGCMSRLRRCEARGERLSRAAVVVQPGVGGSDRIGSWDGEREGVRLLKLYPQPACLQLSRRTFPSSSSCLRRSLFCPVSFFPKAILAQLSLSPTSNMFRAQAVTP